jgi:hypothetical protein
MSIITSYITMKTLAVMVTATTDIPLLIAIYLSAISPFSMINNQSRTITVPVQIHFIVEKGVGILI